MTKIRDSVNLALFVLKWPLALASLATLPGLFDGLLGLHRLGVDAPWISIPWFLGLMVYIVLWRALFRRPSWGSWATTLEHELTHALFATLTFHPVIGLKATWKKGGSVRFIGKGNWLIASAPYFFPLFAFIASLVLLWVPNRLQPMTSAMMGLAQGAFLCGALVSLKQDQSDFKAAGKLFLALFLPTALVLSQLCLVAFAFGGLSALGDTLNGTFGRAFSLWSDLLSQRY